MSELGILEFQNVLGIQAVPFFGTRRFLFLEHGLFLILEPPTKQNLEKKAIDIVKNEPSKAFPHRPKSTDLPTAPHSACQTTQH